jgi:solute carrier family 25 (peroxisomal adenine nucleotide transporter), member 17
MGIGTDGLSQAAAAGAAAATTTLLLYPLDVVKTRLNTGTDEKGVKYDGVLDVLQRQWRRRGLRGFYSGIQVKLVQDVVRSVSFFYVFAVFKGMYKKRFGAIGVRDNLLLGYLSATLNLLFTMPVEVCNTRQMTGFSEGGILSIGCDLIKRQGLAGLYTGICANFLLCLNPAIKHCVFDQAKARLLLLAGGRKRLPALESFLLGAIATMIASTMTFPAARVRAILQTQRLSAASTSGGMLAAIAVLREIVAKDGWLGLYKGLGTQLVKGVMSSALMLATKEKLQRYTAILVRVAILMVQLFLAKGMHHVHGLKGF